MKKPPARWTALHIWLGALSAAPCSKASAKGRTRGWLQQLVPPNVSSRVCQPVMALLPWGPSPVPPRICGTVLSLQAGRATAGTEGTPTARGVQAPPVLLRCLRTQSPTSAPLGVKPTQPGRQQASHTLQMS